MLTISTRGEYSGTVTYHREKFVLANNILTMPMPTWSRNSKLFIASAIKKIGYGGYSGYPRKETLKDDIIYLPINSNNKINFDFMNTFISELEAYHISELEAYLNVTGLKDYKLTKSEKQAIDKYLSNSLIYKEFRLIEIFENIKQGRRLKKDDQIIGNIPFVMSGVSNNGVVGYISNPVTFFKKNSITIDIFGNCFYRNYDYGAGDDTGVYWSGKHNYDMHTMLFFTAVLYKFLYGKYSFGKKLRSSQSINFKIKLPVDKSEKLDFSFMKNLISAIQKLIIKDVVLYSEKKIKMTKKVVKSEVYENNINIK